MPPRTRRRRSASQERDELAGRAAAGGDIGRLAEVIADLVQQRPAAAAAAPPRREFRLPKYDGKSDIELFRIQFMEIGVRNEWDDATGLLHLKEALIDDARDCSRGATLELVFETLRLRFGVSRREARTKLNSMQRESSVTLQEHSIELQRLVEIAYPDYSRPQKAEMALDSFITTLGNVRLQQHLLAVNPPDIAAGVTAGNSYLQVQTTTKPTRGRAHVIQDLEDDNSESEELLDDQAQPKVKVVIAPVKNNVELALLKMMELLSVISGKLMTPKKPFQRKARMTEQMKQGTIVCWGCGEKGHFRTECKNPTGNTTPHSGNDSRPQA
jgi:hypothetical protein